MSEKKWIRHSLSHLQQRLQNKGYRTSRPTVCRLLKKAKYSQKANKKRYVGVAHPHRNAQFEYLIGQRTRFLEAGLPVISVDTKKKELIGNFKNAGRTWSLEAEEVNLHDFAQEDTLRAVPYGLYDVTYNRGFVSVGSSADTPEFAVNAIASWWEHEGCLLYPKATRLLILADAGGSNGCRPHAWKQQLQQQLSDRFGLEVTVCHYPTGCSKWNPIEYRLFSPISINWAGKPLRCLETMLACIRGTTTRMGLTVKAFLLEGIYETGLTVTKDEMKKLSMTRHNVCPNWNYTFRPRPTHA